MKQVQGRVKRFFSKVKVFISYLTAKMMRADLIVLGRKEWTPRAI